MRRWRTWILTVSATLAAAFIAVLLSAFFHAPHDALKAQIETAKANAARAESKAESCCDKAHANEVSIEGNRATLNEIRRSLASIDTNVRHFMLRRGVPPIESE